MTIIFDSLLTVSLSSFEVLPYDAIPLSAAKASPSWPVLSISLDTFTVSAVEVTRIIDCPYNECVYARITLIDSVDARS